MNAFSRSMRPIAMVRLTETQLAAVNAAAGLLRIADRDKFKTDVAIRLMKKRGAIIHGNVSAVIQKRWASTAREPRAPRDQVLREQRSSARRADHQGGVTTFHLGEFHLGDF